MRQRKLFRNGKISSQKKKNVARTFSGEVGNVQRLFRFTQTVITVDESPIKANPNYPNGKCFSTIEEIKVN